jgi:hypothetical protein
MTDRDATMSVIRANLIAIVWLPVSGGLALGPFVLLWGAERIESALPAATDLRFALPVLAVSVLLHEILHAVGFRLLGQAPREAIRIGFQRRTLTPFASCSTPVRANAYRSAALLPGAVLGLVPVLAGCLAGNATMVLYGWVMLAVAGGDLAAVWAIRDVPGEVLVLDHPQRVGCRITEKQVASGSYQ